MLDDTEAPAGSAAGQDAGGAEQESAKPGVREAIAAIRGAVESGAQPTELEDPRIVERLGGEVVGVSKPRDGDRVAGQGGEAAEDAGDGEAAPEDLDHGSGRIVRLPNVRNTEGHQPVELEVEDEQTAAELRAAVRGGLRRDEFYAAKADLESLQAEVQEVVDMIEIDPANFVYSQVPEHFRAALAAQLLADPAVAAQLEELQGVDPERLRADRLEGRQRWQAEVAGRKQARQAARAIRDTVERMIPETFPESRAQALRDDLLRDAADFLNANPGTVLRPTDLPALVASRLKLYGLDPEAAAAAATADGPPPARIAREAAARGAAQKFGKRAATRRSAAGVPGAGAGSPAAAPALPAGQGIKARVKTLRQRFGLA